MVSFSVFVTFVVLESFGYLIYFNDPQSLTTYTDRPSYEYDADTNCCFRSTYTSIVGSAAKLDVDYVHPSFTCAERRDIGMRRSDTNWACGGFYMKDKFGLGYFEYDIRIPQTLHTESSIGIYFTNSTANVDARYQYHEGGQLKTHYDITTNDILLTECNYENFIKIGILRSSTGLVVKFGTESLFDTDHVPIPQPTPVFEGEVTVFFRCQPDLPSAQSTDFPNYCEARSFSYLTLQEYYDSSHDHDDDNGGGGNGSNPNAVIVPVVVVSSLCFFFFIIVVIAVVFLVIVLCVGLCCICCICSCFFCAIATDGFSLTKFRMFVENTALSAELLTYKELTEPLASVPQFEINKELLYVDANEVKLVRIIGDGGSDSVVYEAIWKGEKVAYKVFRTSMMTDASNEEKFKEFEREVGLMSSISHPSIIRFYGTTVDPQNKIGIILEYAVNGSLRDHVLLRRKREETPLSLLEKIRILSEIIGGMDYLHSRNIIHRDLKSANVLLDQNLRAKIIDFGLSRVIRNVNEIRTRRIGTSWYMAPEIVIGDSYDTKIDVFAFAIIAFELLEENFKPYSAYGAENYSVEIKVANTEDYRPKFENEELQPDWMVEMIKRCWKHKPEDRPSFSELVDIFDENS